MLRRNYKLYEVICPICKQLNTYELPLTDTQFEGKPRPIWANNRRLEAGARCFPCQICQNPIRIGG